jgi:nucleoside-diphosphate-sugar epimerase
VANIGGGNRITMNRVLGLLDELAAPVRVVWIPDQSGDVRHTAADITLARRAFGYQPRVDIREGLRAMVEAERVTLSAVAR